MAKVLVTGGAGFIGSHACVELLDAGHDVVVVDDLSNSHAQSLDRVREITERDLSFYRVDICDAEALRTVFERHEIDAVMHFAGYKAVGESVEKPLEYYRNNVGGTLTLLEAMRRHEVWRLVFSSSCTVYGEPEKVPIDEGAPRSAASPYGQTKLVIEHILEDLAVSDERWRISLLRYFNPVGAHPSGRIGEEPRGIPNNLLPYLVKVAAGQLPELRIFGGDYPTRDGTCIRDYIHVVDLARGHLAAMESLELGTGCRAHNLGTGVGTTVLEMVARMEEAIGHPIPHSVVDRRPGDVVAIWADPASAERDLGWKTELDLGAMCRDHWNWQQRNPTGYFADQAPAAPSGDSTQAP